MKKNLSTFSTVLLAASQCSSNTALAFHSSSTIISRKCSTTTITFTPVHHASALFGKTCLNAAAASLEVPTALGMSTAMSVDMNVDLGVDEYTRNVYKEWCQTFGKEENSESYQVFAANYAELQSSMSKAYSGMVRVSEYADLSWDDYVKSSKAAEGEINAAVSIQNMKVPELKEECKQRNLLASGKKAEIVKRLKIALRFMATELPTESMQEQVYPEQKPQELMLEVEELSNDEQETTEIIDFTSMKVVELKEECKSRGLPVSGRKADLIQRLEVVTGVDQVVVEGSQNFFASMTVKELKEKCREMSLPVSGNKATLIARLQATSAEVEAPADTAQSTQEIEQEEEVVMVNGASVEEVKVKDEKLSVAPPPPATPLASASPTVTSDKSEEEETTLLEDIGELASILFTKVSKNVEVGNERNQLIQQEREKVLNQKQQEIAQVQKMKLEQQQKESEKRRQEELKMLEERRQAFEAAEQRRREQTAKERDQRRKEQEQQRILALQELEEEAIAKAKAEVEQAALRQQEMLQRKELLAQQTTAQAAEAADREAAEAKAVVEAASEAEVAAVAATKAAAEAEAAIAKAKVDAEREAARIKNFSVWKKPTTPKPQATPAPKSAITEREATVSGIPLSDIFASLRQVRAPNPSTTQEEKKNEVKENTKKKPVSFFALNKSNE